MGRRPKSPKAFFLKKLEGWSINKLAEQIKGDSTVC
jgi:hypothetical protein